MGRVVGECSLWGECGGCGKACWGKEEVRGNVERGVGKCWGRFRGVREC